VHAAESLLGIAAAAVSLELFLGRYLSQQLGILGAYLRQLVFCSRCALLEERLSI
jgi:hypothetical protein